MNILAATRHLAFVGKLFAAAGLSLEAMLKTNDESALKAHLESLTVPAATTTVATVDCSQIEHDLLARAGVAQAAGVSAEDALKKVMADHAAALAAVEAKVIAADGKASASAAQLTAFHASLTAAGVKLSADAKPEALGAAITGRVATLAAEELAKRGLAEFPQTEIVADPAAAGAGKNKKELKGLARVQAAFAKESERA